jgi:glycosyltransferase involved in cell wall biosynthesis
MASDRTPELGIGIITYNRLEALRGCVSGVREYTGLPICLVVADDGSADGSAEWAREQGLVVISGRNRGPAWNRNRALYHLLEHTPSDPILLLEDDCWPVEPGWAVPWIEAAARWGHLNYPLDLIVGGSGTPDDPYRCRVSGTQCTVTTREALQAVGYLDTRFAGYGYEDAEWTFRFERYLADRWVPPLHAPPCLRCGLQVMPLGTWHDAASVARQLPLFEALRQEPIWRPAWRTPDEEAIVREEQGLASLRQRTHEQQPS